MAKAKKNTNKKEIKEEIELRVEDYLTMGEDVEILSVEDTIEEKFGELVPVLEQRLKEHTKFLIEKQKHVDEINNSAEISESKAEIKLLGEKAYLLQSASDGFLINDAESGKNFFSINKTGSVAFGTINFLSNLK